MRAAKNAFLSAALWSGLSQAAPAQLVANQGGLDGLVSFMLIAPQSTASYWFDERGTKIKLMVRSYRSAPAIVDENDNRCTASSSDNTITCDLRLIDALTKRFGLTGRYKFLPQKESQALYKRVLLKWIVAHEIGHIALAHGKSDLQDPPSGLLLFDEAQQVKELAADKYALSIVGNLDSGGIDEYGVLMEIANALLSKALCPKTFPKSCENLQPGVGLIYNSGTRESIKIEGGGKHPAFVARFVRLLYLAGEGTDQNAINYLAGQIMDQFLIERQPGVWVPAKQAFAGR